MWLPAPPPSGSPSSHDQGKHTLAKTKRRPSTVAPPRPAPRKASSGRGAPPPRQRGSRGRQARPGRSNPLVWGSALVVVAIVLVLVVVKLTSASNGGGGPTTPDPADVVSAVNN